VAYSPFKGEEGVQISRSKGKRLLALVASVLMLALVSPVVGAGATSQSAQDPEDVAIGFIQDNTQDYGVSSADVSDLRVSAPTRVPTTASLTSTSTRDARASRSLGDTQP
jgi:hypothetical protein